MLHGAQCTAAVWMPYRGNLHKESPCIPDSNPSLAVARADASSQAGRAMSANTSIALDIPWQPGLPMLLLHTPAHHSRAENHAAPSTPSRRYKDAPVQLASGFPNPQLISFTLSAAPFRCCPKMSVIQLLTFRVMTWCPSPSSDCKQATEIY